MLRRSGNPIEGRHAVRTVPRLAQDQVPRIRPALTRKHRTDPDALAYELRALALIYQAIADRLGRGRDGAGAPRRCHFQGCPGVLLKPSPRNGGRTSQSPEWITATRGKNARPPMCGIRLTPNLPQTRCSLFLTADDLGRPQGLSDSPLFDSPATYTCSNRPCRSSEPTRLFVPPVAFISSNLFQFKQPQDLQGNAPGHALVKGQPYFVAEVLEVQRSLHIPLRRGFVCLSRSVRIWQ
jgi:hypothetical protein